MTVASRVAVMDEGRIMQVETPERIYEVPRSVYVADFIGDVNILDGTTKSTGDGQYRIDWQEGQTPFVATSDTAFSDGQACHLALRPEKVSIHMEKPDGADNVIEGEIHDIAYLGNLSTYHVLVPGGRIIKAQTANTRRISRRNFTWEDKVWLSWTESAGVMLSE